MINPEIEAKLMGRGSRFKNAQRDRSRYLRERFDDLVVDLGALGTDLADRNALFAKHAAKGDRDGPTCARWEPLIAISGHQLVGSAALAIQRSEACPAAPAKAASRRRVARRAQRNQDAQAGRLAPGCSYRGSGTSGGSFGVRALCSRRPTSFGLFPA